MNDPLRVLKVAACPFPWARGTPIRIQRLAAALARSGHEVHVATYHLGAADPTAGVITHRIPDVPGYRHTDPGPTFTKLLRLDPMLVKLLRRLHTAVPFDIVHAHHYEGLLTARLAGSQVPVVYDAHTTLAGELPYYRTGLSKRLSRKLGKWLDHRLPRHADFVISVSESIRAVLLAGGAVSPDGIRVIPNGVDSSLFAGADVPSATGRERLIFTGNLAPYQRIDLLLEVFQRVVQRRPHARLSIVTDASFEPYQDQAKRLGIHHSIDVVSAPFVDQPDLLRRADVALNPRVECDGIPQKLLNYMASGTPLVTFDGSGAHVRHGETGLRVKDGDTGAMAAAVDLLLSDRELAARIGTSAQREVQSEFSWERVAARVTEVYRSVHAAEWRRGATVT